MLRFNPQDFQAFTDRREQLAAFRALVQPGTPTPVLIFTGMSGNGKTFLTDYLIHTELPEGAPYALLDLEANPDLLGVPEALINALLPVLGALARGRQRDYTATLARILDRRDSALQNLQIHQDIRAEQGASVTASQDVNLARQIDAIKTRARCELGDALAALAQTIRRPDTIRVLFLDGYEYLRRGDERYEAWIWNVWRALADALPGLRVVVAGREPPRGRLPAARPDALRMFAWEESLHYLRKRGVGDEGFCRHLHGLTQGHPLLLWMAADLATAGSPLTLRELETAPGADAGQRPVAGWLYERIIARLSENRPLAEAVTLLRRYDPDILTALLPGCISQEVRDFSHAYTAWIRPHASGGWAVHDLVGRARAAALVQDGAAAVERFHAQAAAAWQARWERTGSPVDLAEALYHRLWSNEEEAFAEWEQHVMDHTLAADRESWRPVALATADPRLEEKPLDRARAASAALRRGRWLYYNTEWQAALETYAAALGLFRAVGDRLGEANTLKAIGDVQQFRKELAAALETYAAALGLFRAVGDRLGEANTYRSTGLLSVQQGNPAQAFDRFSQALELHRAIGDRYSAAADCFYRAEVLVALKRVDEAKADLAFALQVFEALELPYAEWVRRKLESM